MKPWEQFGQDSAGPWTQFAPNEAPQKPEKPKQYKIGVAGLPDAIKETMKDYNPLSRAAMGAYAALDNAALRAKQLVTGGLNPADEATAIANRQVTRDPFALGGNIGATVLGLRGVGSPGLPSAVGVGAGHGYLADPELGNESNLGKAALGGTFGGLFNLGARAITGTSIVPQTYQSRALLQAGGSPTLGQTLHSNPNPIAQAAARIEEKSQSIPFLGDAITAARTRAISDWRRAALAGVVPPGSEAIRNTGDEGIAAVRNAMSGGYDDVYRGVNVTLDARLLQEIAAAKNSPQLPLNAERGRQFDEIVRNVVTERLRPGVSIPADVAKTEIEKSLGQHARKFSSELRTPEENALGEALTGARTAFRGLMARSIGNDPARLRALDRLDADYPNWLAIRAAADRAKAQGGQFTPFQLQSTAHRGLPIREWADIGQRVLPTTVGNSFTADRAAVGQVAGLAATGGLGAVLGSPALIAATALPLAYSRTGTRWLQGAVTPEELQLLSPYISRAATFGLLSDPDKPTR